MEDAGRASSENVAVVEKFIAGFNRRWPTEEELAEVLAPGVVFVERPNLVNPTGTERDVAAMRAGLELGRKLLAWQTYDVRDHVVSGDTVVTRMRWSAEIAVDAWPLAAGTRMSAWCVAHYRLAEGLIVHIEQHDCYDQPSPPAG
jgi:ketosteroid isomerase-like protein